MGKIPSTDSSTAPGEFTTTNTALAFATGSTDLMVVFKGSNNITVQAQGVNPSNAGNQIKWKVDRDPSDSVETGLPTISPQIGETVTLTPNKAGNFRLISYYDANNNNTFDNGEELKVLRFAIVRIFVLACTLETENQFMGRNLGDHYKVETVPPVEIRCSVSLQSGGGSSDIGLDKVKMGNVGNLISEENQVTYEIGNALENPNPGGGGLPMVATTNPVLSGGNSVFRVDSSDPGNVSGRQIRSEYKPDIGPFLIQHPDQNNGTTWNSTLGTLFFTEFIAAYSETFLQHYVVVAKATVQISFNGSRNGNGDWQNLGSAVFLQGSQTPSANFTKTIDSQGSVTTGSSEGMKVSGTPYDASAIYEYSQP